MDSHRYDPFAQGPVAGTRPHTPPYGMAPIQAPAPGRPMTPPHGFPPPRLPMAPMPAPAAWTTTPAPGAVPPAPEAPTTATATPPPSLGSPKKSRPKKSPKLIAAAVALALTAGAGAGATFFDLFGSGNEFQTVAYAGQNPFTSPVGADRPGVASIGGGTQPSDAGEMYAQDPAKPACDSASLVKQLKADPKKAAAWAQVQRIQPAQLSTYVDGLTPVTLRANTAVVDHSYAKGTFQATPAVLAAGTAVFINAYGQPTVKCFSGNPLTPGESTDPAVTTVTPAAAPIATNVFHNVTTGGASTSPGRPDTTGTGPNTGGGGNGGGGGNSGGGGGTTPAKPALTGTWNHDGSITRSDRSIQLANGTIVTPKIPEGATPLDDGGFIKDGKFFNANGTERTEIELPGQRITLEGRLVDTQGNPVPLPEGFSIKRNYDGTMLLVQKGQGEGQDVVAVLDAQGKIGTAVIGTFDPKTGSVTDKDGKVLNPNNTPRTKTKIEGGGELGPDGENIPPKKGTTDEDKDGDKNKNALTEDGKQTTEDATKEDATKEDATKEDATKDGTDGTTDGTDQKIDPVTGFPIDPVTGFPTDPATGQAIDPATGQPIDPATGLPIEQAPVEQQPIAPAPVDPPVEEVPVEQAPVEQAPVEQAPVEEAPVEQAPAESSSSSGASSDTSSGGGESSGGEG